VLVVLLSCGIALGQEYRDRCRGVKVKPPIDTHHLISYGVINARAVDLVTPVYPPAASAVNVHGLVELEVVISEKGCVVRAETRSGHPFLIPAAKRAALASLFEPVFLGRKRTRGVGIIVYHFHL